MGAGQPPRGNGRFVAAGLLLGVGLGGFVDGIVLHQILQWHHMLTSTSGYPATTVAGLEANTFWDGLFHAATWVAVTVGLALLWDGRGDRVQPRPPGRSLVGLLLAGWGLFNLVEGVVDHHLLGIHHVRAGPDQLAYDLGFLALGAILVAAGWVLYRSGRLAGRPETPGTAAGPLAESAGRLRGGGRTEGRPEGQPSREAGERRTG